MNREHLVLLCFAVLVAADLVFLLRGGVPTRQRLLRGLAALVVLALLAGGLSWFLSPHVSYSIFKDDSISFSDAGIGILFIGLATLGCWCADQRQ